MRQFSLFSVNLSSPAIILWLVCIAAMSENGKETDNYFIKFRIGFDGKGGKDIHYLLPLLRIQICTPQWKISLI